MGASERSYMLTSQPRFRWYANPTGWIGTRAQAASFTINDFNVQVESGYWANDDGAVPHAHCPSIESLVNGE
jgi:hypothetical protein